MQVQIIDNGYMAFWNLLLQWLGGGDCLILQKYYIYIFYIIKCMNKNVYLISMK